MNSQAVADYRHHDADIEALLVAHVLARPLCLPDVLQHVRPDDFAGELWGRILETAALIRDEDFKVSPAMVKARLSGETIRAIEGEGGAFTALQFLENVARSAGPNTNPVELAKTVADLSMRRRLDAELEAARERLCDYARPVMDCLGGIIDATGEAAMGAAKRKGFLPISKATGRAEGGLRSQLGRWLKDAKSLAILTP